MATTIEPDVLTPAELVRAFQAGIWRYLRYLGADEAQADDLTQETFVAVISRPPEQRSRGETAAYLRTVARNLFLSSRRREGRMLRLEELEIADEVWLRLTGGSDDLWLDALQDCLGHTSERAQVAIDLHYRQEMSREAIAKELELKPEGVKTLLRRTRAALRDCIERKLNS